MQTVSELLFLLGGIVLRCSADSNNSDFSPSLVDFAAKADAIFLSDPDYASCLQAFLGKASVKNINWTEVQPTHNAFQDKCREFLEQFGTGFNLEMQFKTPSLRHPANRYIAMPDHFPPRAKHYLCWDASRRRIYNCNGRRKRDLILGPADHFCLAYPNLCSLTGRHKRMVIPSGPLPNICTWLPRLCTRQGGRGKRFVGLCARYPTLCGITGRTFPSPSFCTYRNGWYQCAA